MVKIGGRGLSEDMTETGADDRGSHEISGPPWWDIPCCLYHDRQEAGGEGRRMVAQCLFKVDQITILT